VSGYCNAVPSNDEAKWDWVACCDDSLNINFADLWFAFRGGGGGSYGVLTSLHYQLHDYPGPLTIVAADATQLLPLVSGLNETAVYLLYCQYIEFIHLYLFVPSGVSELDSRGCNRYVYLVQSRELLWPWYVLRLDFSLIGCCDYFVAYSAQTADLRPAGIFYCYGSSGQTMVTKWQEKVTNETSFFTSSFGLNEAIIAAVYGIMVPSITVESYAHFVVSDGIGNHPVPAGRLVDEPKKRRSCHYWAAIPTMPTRESHPSPPVFVYHYLERCL
jgi:hypothetical protein